MVVLLLLSNGSYLLHMSLNITNSGEYNCIIDNIQSTKSIYLMDV
jgi:hypothetical protein